MSEKIFKVAVDDGYAQTKVYGESDSGLIKFKMRSSVRSGRFGLGDISGENFVGLYETEEGPFTVSEEVEAENTQFDGYHLSVMNRVIVNHALVSAGYSGKNVDLVVGLPVSDFFSNRIRDKEKIERKIENLKRTIKPDSEDILAKISSVDVGCQAVAAFADYFLDDNGVEKNVDIDQVAIVDIGGRTTDIAVIVDATKVDHSRSGTMNIGVLDVYNLVQKSIASEFKLRDDFALKVLDAAVKNKFIKIWNRKEDISKIVRDAIIEIESKIVREIERKIGSGAVMSAVLFVGGGSALFNEIVANNYEKNGVLLEDPEFSNARGLFKYNKYHSSKE